MALAQDKYLHHAKITSYIFPLLILPNLISNYNKSNFHLSKSKYKIYCLTLWLVKMLEKVYFKSRYWNTSIGQYWIVSSWITLACSKEHKYHIFRQYWYTRNGTFQYLGHEVYFFQKANLNTVQKMDIVTWPITLYYFDQSNWQNHNIPTSVVHCIYIIRLAFSLLQYSWHLNLDTKSIYFNMRCSASRGGLCKWSQFWVRAFSHL